MTRNWNEDDLDALDWCNSTIHGLNIVPQSNNTTSLVLDIDYVIAWDKPQPNNPNYRVASANLIFRDVSEFQVAMNRPTNGRLWPLRIDYVNRRDSVNWRIGFYDVGGDMFFTSSGFDQALTSDVVNCHSKIQRNAG